MIDMVFFLDIIIMFRTAITNDDGDIVTDMKTIAAKYLKSSFCIDLLATVPIDSLLGIFLSDEVSS